MNEFRLETPRLNPVPFIVADIVLVGAAALIGWRAPAPLGTAALAGIAACVAIGAVILLYPFVVNHARRQEEAMQERADQIEALARTVSASAEQISIAASNLPAIAENSARQLKAAEQLPAALKQQLAGLQQQLAATANEENAALRHDLDTLRSAETSKLVAALDGLSRATADLARLETLAAKHSAALDQALEQLPRVADAFGTRATEAIRHETASAIEALRAAAAEAGKTLATATAHSSLAFDRGLADAIRQLSPQTPPPAAAEAPKPARATPKTRHTKTPGEDTPPAPAPAPAPEPLPESSPAPLPPGQSVSAEAPVGLLVDDAGLDEPESAPAAAPTDTGTQADADTDAETHEGPELGLDIEPASASTDPALSHDGFTRLIATAYIGIGNRLFIRGDGPGLSREKGVPLQFVSIGKWRWENADLGAPAQVKLYKNDQIECVALGEFTLQPGHHHEVNAAF
jgi:hypothetical protein